MKKALCVVLSFIVVLSFSSCSLSEYGSELQTRVVLNWMKYLDMAGESINGNLWALGYISEYCKEPSYDGYLYSLMASAVLSGHFEDVLSESMPVFDMTEADYDTLADDSGNFSLMAEKLSSAASFVEDEKVYWSQMWQDITDDAFWDKGIGCISLSAELKKEEILLEAVYLRCLTNYILLVSGCEEFPEVMKENTYGIIDNNTPFEKDIAVVENSINTCIQSKEKLSEKRTELSDVRGEKERVFSDAYQDGDISELSADICSWGKDFSAVPLPLWDETELSVYHYTEDSSGEVLNFVKIGDDLKNLDTDYSVSVEGVTKEQYTAYISHLVSLGAKYAVENGSFYDDKDIMCYVKVGHELISCYLEGGKFSMYLDSDESFICREWYSEYCGKN